MNIQDAQTIRQLAITHFHDQEFVHAIIQKIVLLNGAGQRRLALAALVDQLIAADELEEAVNVARLAPDLTPHAFVNDVDYFLKAALLLAIVDRLLDQQRLARATQLLDEASLSMQDLHRYDYFDMPLEAPWLQLTRRYARADLPARIHQIWDQAITWARSLEQSMAIPDPHLFQPDQGSGFLVGIAEDMARLGQYERASAVAAAIVNESHRSLAMARVHALLAETRQVGPDNSAE